MTSPDRTWLTLVRDLSDVISIEGESSIIACMVLEAETGLVAGMSVGPSTEEACVEALEMGLSGAFTGTEAGPPDQVACAADLAADVRTCLGKVLEHGHAPPVADAVIGPEAEDILDSLVGHLSGRNQPEVPPAPDDWQLLFQHVYEFSRAEPWNRWPDDTLLELIVNVDGTPGRYVAAIIGQQGIQRGLALYPGGAVPDATETWKSGDPPPVPPGTILCHLEPMVDTPADQLNRATRYGWPDGTDLAPILFGVADEGPADLSREAAQHLTLAAAAVVAHSPDSGTSTGNVHLPHDGEGTFTIG